VPIIKALRLLSIALYACAASGQQITEGAPFTPDDHFVPGPDSRPQPGVPQGKTFEFALSNSRYFPGTTRTIYVYVPAQYKAEGPACLYVGLDRLIYEVPTVFDNLISKHEMPLTIAIGVSPGVVESARPPENPRFNRSLEFDGLDDTFARFLIDEVVPEVERRKTPDGLPILLSRSPNDRAVAGSSTGGIGAFTLAWQRPDLFRRVFISIGTFVGMRGGDRYPVLVRKTEPKPIRIYMQDGSNDEWMGGPELGDWWMGNQSMVRALEFSGYQIAHTFGDGAHSSRHATVIFPDAMRWLWKDWPTPIAAGSSQNTFLQSILQSDEGWKRVAGDYGADGPLTADIRGAIVFKDHEGSASWKVFEEAGLKPVEAINRAYSGLAFGPDGRAYLIDTGSAKILRLDLNGKLTTIASGIYGQDLVVSHGGNIYVTDSRSGSVWLITPSGRKLLLDENLRDPYGITLSPDGLWLAVAERRTHWGYSYRVQPDGSVAVKQRFFWFHQLDEDDSSEARGWVMDRDGRLYSATQMGIQVFDRNGRVRAIIPAPGGPVLGLTFGGPEFDTLYVSCADHKIYSRKLKVNGAPAWTPPVKLPKWSAG
jgi:gluconolactonase